MKSNFGEQVRPGRKGSSMGTLIQAGLLIVACVAAFFAAQLAIPTDEAFAEKPVAGLKTILITPVELNLQSNEMHHLLVTGMLESELATDLTPGTLFKSDQPKIASIDREGIVRALRPGVAIIKLRTAGQNREVRVLVKASESETGLSFVNDVLPIL